MINPTIAVVKNKTGNSYKVKYELYENGKRTRPSMTFKKKKEAELYRNELIQKYGGREEFINKDTKKLHILLDEVLVTHKSKVFESTFKRYSSFSRKIKNYFAESISLKDLNVKRIEDFYNAIVNTKSDRTNSNPYSEVEKLHKYFHLVMDYAFKWGYVNNNILNKVCPPKGEKKEVEYWTHKDMNTFLNFISNDLVFYNPIFFSLNTGARIAEVCGLRWGDIDFSNNVVKIRKQLNQSKKLGKLKTSSSRRDVPLFDDLRELLLNLNENTNHNNDDFVFLTKLGQPFSPTSLSKSFGIRVRKCINENPDLKKITFHGLRHTYVTLCVTELHIPIEAISKIVGHSKVSITSDIYFHLNENMAQIYFLNKSGFNQKKVENDPKIRSLAPNGTKKAI